jgi:HSP20 family protein
MLALRFNTSALDEMFNLTGELDQVFGNNGNGMPRRSAWTPSVEVQETEDFVSMAVELPGVNAEDVALSVENGLLTIAGEKKPAHQHEKGTTALRYSERWYGRFERTFSLPAGIDAGRIDASFDAGILTIRLHKSEQAKARRIAIAVGSGTATDARITSGQK